MTDSNHPITPPPELLKQWVHEFYGGVPISPGEASVYIATQAARWGADQELEACCEWIANGHSKQGVVLSNRIRAARRPKPPSLKEQAKFAAAVLRSPDETCSITELQQHWHTICNALEQLND